MTLPIIPGPFSFLQGAGQALGAFGQARTEQEHYANALALQRQQAALQAATLLQRIISPEAFAQGGVGGQLLQQAGVGAISPGQIEVPPQVALGRRQKQELSQLPVGSTQSQLTTGIATKGQAAQDLATQNKSQVAAQAFAGLTDEQAQAFEGVLPQEIVKIGNEAKKQQLITSIAQQEPARVEAKMQQDIAESVRKRLPKDAQFEKVADYAKVGAIGYLEEQLNAWARVNEGSKALDTQRLRTVLETTKQAGTAYRAAHAQWLSGLQKAVSAVTALGGAGQDKSPEEQQKLKNAAAQEYIDRFGAEPKADDYLNEALDANGIELGDYQKAYRDLLKVTGQGASPGGGFAAVVERHKQHPYSNAEIDAAVKDGQISPSQGAQLKALSPKK